MAYIDQLLESGGNFILKRSEGDASFAPASDKDSDLQSFQMLVRRLREHDGDGYSIFREHESSDHAEPLVDLVLVTLDID